MKKIIRTKIGMLVKLGVLTLISITLTASPEVFAANNFYSSNDILFYDPNATSCSVSTGANATTSGSVPAKFPAGQVQSFAGEPITSTWNISDNTVEQWFLKQAGARATVSRYGLNSGNISSITSTVKAANVSPVFFYLYTVNEGGGAGGFINHYSSSSGNGVDDAKRDAQYIATQSQIMTDNPSWVDAGNPVNFVPQNIQDAGNTSFKSMPSGTIGRIYIPATAAATWESYYPDGLKKAFNQVQDYSGPLGDAMQNIQAMGGNPLQGGATITSGGGGGCGGGVAGAGIMKAVNWAIMIAKNDGYGYDESARTTGWPKWQSDPSCTNACGSFDCSSFISAALTEAGYFSTDPNFTTPYEGGLLQQAGFVKVANSAHTSAGLQPGDILVLASTHTEMYIGNNQSVGAHRGNGTPVGDQSGDEISVTPYYDDGWDGVYRATK